MTFQRLEAPPDEVEYAADHWDGAIKIIGEGQKTIFQCDVMVIFRKDFEGNAAALKAKIEAALNGVDFC